MAYPGQIDTSFVLAEPSDERDGRLSAFAISILSELIDFTPQSISLAGDQGFDLGGGCHPLLHWPVPIRSDLAG